MRRQIIVNNQNLLSVGELSSFSQIINDCFHHEERSETVRGIILTDNDQRQLGAEHIKCLVDVWWRSKCRGLLSDRMHLVRSAHARDRYFIHFFLLIARSLSIVSSSMIVFLSRNSKDRVTEFRNSTPFRSTSKLPSALHNTEKRRSV